MCDSADECVDKSRVAASAVMRSLRPQTVATLSYNWSDRYVGISGGFRWGHSN